MSAVAKGSFSFGSDIWPGLSKIVEESGELGQVLGKIMMVGGVEHWDGDLTPALEDELADLAAALAVFGQLNRDRLDMFRMEQRRLSKMAKFMEWHVEQRK